LLCAIALFVGETADGGVGDTQVCTRREQHYHLTL